MCPPSAGATHRWEYASPGGTLAKIPDCVPADTISQAAYGYAQKHLRTDILNHSIRVYLLAHGLGMREQSPLVSQAKVHLLFTASILHDIGTVSAHNGSQRFEVEGADAASDLLISHGVSESDAHDVWTAIAIHSSPGIAERISPLSRLVRMGVAMDFKRSAALRLTSEEEVGRVEGIFPRGQIEKVLGDVVVAQVLGRDGDGREAVDFKAPAASWPGVLVRSTRENPGWEGVNKAF